MKKAFKERSIKAFDIALYMVQPVRILLFGVIALIGYLSMIAQPGTFFTMSEILPSHILSVILFVIFCIIFVYNVTKAKKTKQKNVIKQ